VQFTRNSQNFTFDKLVCLSANEASSFRLSRGDLMTLTIRRAAVACAAFLAACGDAQDIQSIFSIHDPAFDAGVQSPPSTQDAGTGADGSWQNGATDDGDAAVPSGDPSTTGDPQASPGDAGTASDNQPDAGNGGTGEQHASTDDVPPGDHCASVAIWPAESAAFEEEVLRLTNEARAKGHDCDTKGNFGPAGPLTMEPHLRCSARLHTLYMTSTGNFSHTESNGSQPEDRMTAAGYVWSYSAENIAAGQQTPEDVVQAWLDSDGHCRNIMIPELVHIGIGYALGALKQSWGSVQAPYWTQNFGAPR
jgi:uncharacterized protein YkwD